jgi:hypothetical protein
MLRNRSVHVRAKVTQSLKSIFAGGRRATIAGWAALRQNELPFVCAGLPLQSRHAAPRRSATRHAARRMAICCRRIFFQSETHFGAEADR